MDDGVDTYSKSDCELNKQINTKSGENNNMNSETQLLQDSNLSPEVCSISTHEKSFEIH